MKRIVIFPIFLLLSATLFGCTVTSEQEKDYSSQEITIYASESEEQFFYQSYGNLILEHFPGLEIRVITPPYEMLGQTNVEEIKKHAPDLIVSYTNDYKELVADSYLSSIDNLIKKDSFDIDKYSNSMISYLRDESGVLYGLSPDAYISGIFYNKDLINHIGLDHPTNGMDWFELLQLATRFTNGIAGFENSSNPSGLLMNIAATNGWYFIDKEMNEITFEIGEWEKAIQTIVDLYDANSFVKGSGDLFFQGKSALYEGNLSYVTKLLDTNEFTWGVITQPVNTNSRNVSQSVGFNRVLSIPTESTHRELAWDIMKVLMSEEAAEHYEDNQLSTTISTLKTHMYNYKGINLEAFWEQSINSSPNILNDELTREFINEFYSLLDDSLYKTINHEISVEECFELIIKGAEEAYDKERLRNANK
ncbi:ABC transporter substrate-binding protein [Paenibacillus yanchengensis]|uniref:ABC transporter substrate-binding protein n=1 Tax=Paenibacillus yanchengensis TaxID=2035833 RepID=A0ABW4YJ86_9BACL